MSSFTKLLNRPIALLQIHSFTLVCNHLLCNRVSTRLMNSRFCGIWARMNHFEARLMITKVDSILSTQLKYFIEEKTKMATAILEILEFFSLVPTV